MPDPVVALLAGEASGDNLGAPLIRQLAARLPNARFVGIGGPNMIEAGLESWIEMERLSVNGFVDPLLRFPDLLRILLSTRDRIVASKPLCFVGIDFNFFNLLLEGMLHKQGIKTVHYVSPTVWAWRKGRIRSIAKKVDLMLTLYPFELEIYQQHQIPAVFVGHPKADEISPGDGLAGMPAARAALGFKKEDTVIAILPGSRSSEVAYTGPDFFAAACDIRASRPECQFVVPAANNSRKAQIEALLLDYPSLPVRVTLGDSRRAMQAANLVMVNSGTATLEALLLRKPMVMSYRLGGLTYAFVSRLVSTRYFALPNILADKPLVPELIQDAATPSNISSAVLELLSADHEALMLEFDRIHTSLRKNSGEVAAQAVTQLLEVGHVSA